MSMLWVSLHSTTIPNSRQIIFVILMNSFSGFSYFSTSFTNSLFLLIRRWVCEKFGLIQVSVNLSGWAIDRFLRHHIDRFLRISGNAKLSIQLRPTKTSLRELFQPSWISNLFCTTTYPFENIQISKGLVSDESSSRCRSAVNRQSFIWRLRWSRTRLTPPLANQPLTSSTALDVRRKRSLCRRAIATSKLLRSTSAQSFFLDIQSAP